MGTRKTKAKAATASVGQILRDSIAKSAPPKGLLSFMYWVKHDQRCYSAFHGDEAATLKLFGIPVNSTEGRLIVKIPQLTEEEKQRQAVAKLFALTLLDDLTSQIPWTRDVGDETAEEGRRLQPIFLTSLHEANVPRGLLSLLYWTRHDERGRQAFKRDLHETLALFGIFRESEAARQIKKICDATADTRKGELTTLFDEELRPEVLFGIPKKFW